MNVKVRMIGCTALEAWQRRDINVAVRARGMMRGNLAKATSLRKVLA